MDADELEIEICYDCEMYSLCTVYCAAFRYIIEKDVKKG